MDTIVVCVWQKSLQALALVKPLMNDKDNIREYSPLVYRIVLSWAENKTVQLVDCESKREKRKVLFTIRDTTRLADYFSKLANSVHTNTVPMLSRGGSTV